MSERADLRAALLAVLAGLDLGGATPEVWRGEVERFNPDASFPAVFLSYLGCTFGESEEVGVQTYGRTYGFALYVATSDATAPGGDGEAAALEILEAAETGLSGRLPGTAWFVDADGAEELLDATLGRYLYGQRYLVLTLESH